MGDCANAADKEDTQCNLLFGIRDRIRAVTNVAANSKGVVATDCSCETHSTTFDRRKAGQRTGLRIEGVRRTKHGTARLDDIKALKHHAEHGTGLHILDHTGEEGLVLEIGVVCTCVSFDAMRSVDQTWARFSRCSLLGKSSLAAMSWKPRFSNRVRISPMRPRSTPSGCLGRVVSELDAL